MSYELTPSEKSGLSTGAKAAIGVVFGVIFPAAVVAGIVFFLKKRKSAKLPETEIQESKPTGPGELQGSNEREIPKVYEISNQVVYLAQHEPEQKEARPELGSGETESRLNSIRRKQLPPKRDIAELATMEEEKGTQS